MKVLEIISVFSHFILSRFRHKTLQQERTVPPTDKQTCKKFQ
jgi:hypothetical protein